MADEVERKAQIKLPVTMLRVLLDLPDHLEIVEILETPLDKGAQLFTIRVTGPFCPTVMQDGVLKSLYPIYRVLETGHAELEEIQGLDT
jgi:hypothetical protein